MRCIPLILCVLALAPAHLRAQSAPAVPAAVDPVAALSSYDFGGDRAPLQAMDQLLADARTQETARLEWAARLRDVVSNPAAPPGALEYACRTISLLGDGGSVPVIAGRLMDTNSAAVDYARVALERLPGGAAALASALPNISADRRPSLLRSIGAVRDPESVATVGRYLRDKDPATASAAAQSLGRMGTIEAGSVLVKKGNLRDAVVADALLRCADRIAASEPRQAAGWYEDVFDTSDDAPVLEAALIGIASTRPADAGKHLMRLLESGDPASVARALRVARRGQIPDFTQSAVKRINRFTPDSQLALLGLLIDQQDPAVQTVAGPLLESREEKVVLGAIDAIGSAEGTADAIDTLARRAVDGSPTVRKAAAAALVRMKGALVDEVLRAGVASGDEARRLVLIRVTGERKGDGARAALLALRTDSSTAVRRAALQVLDGLVSSADHAPLVDWMVRATDAAEARDAERIVLRAGAGYDRAVSELIAADGAATDEARAALARCLARRGGPIALAHVQGYLTCGRDELERSALRALAGWVDAAPLDTVRELALTSSDERRAGVALQAVIALLALDRQRTPAAKGEVLLPLLNSARSPDLRKMVVSALAEYPGDATLAALTALEQDPGCGAEARAAVRRVRYLSLGAPVVTASHGGGSVGAAVDGNPATRWTTGESMKPGQWLELDLRAPCTIRRVTIDATGSDADYPRAYEVFVGDAAAPAGTAVLKGQGGGAVVELVFEPPVTGRHVRIVQQGRDGKFYWSVHELRVDAELAGEAAR